MSWILGIIGKGRFEESDFNLNREELVFQHKDDTLQIFVGGKNNQTILTNEESNPLRFVSLGLGLFKRNSLDYTIANSTHWNLFFNKKAKLKEFNGHFVTISWNKNSVHFYSDILGLRDLFYCQIDKQIIFSSRIDWLGRLTNSEINYGEFGSRWLLFNQLSSDSVLQGIKRICGGTEVTINREDNSQIIKTYNWQPDSFIQNERWEENFNNTLEKLIFLQNDKKLSLSLSGGLDSRVVLSYLLKNDNNNFDTHTFGVQTHPDYVIAKKIVDKFNFLNENINLSYNSTDILFTKLKEYTNQTIVNNSASAIHQYANYDALLGKDVLTIDGGFGEIWRREFFNRLLFRGEKALLNKDLDSIIPYMSLPRADIFTEEIKNTMYEGCKVQLNNLFNKLPDIKDVGASNWVDIFSVYTRLRNYYGPEQSRIDGIVTSYMPFIQLDLINMLLSVPVSQRKNSKLYRKIIKKNIPELKRFQLAKGSFTHPFRLSSIQVRIYNLMMSRLAKQSKENTQIKFLNKMEDFVNDSLNSTSARNYLPYDHKKVQNLITEFYKGNFNYTYQLDWLISFEIFRQTITK